MFVFLCPCLHLGETEYTEGPLFGYRWYDVNAGLSPLFPFGHGLSYTTFQYSNNRVTVNSDKSVTVTMTLRNTGSVSGSEVVQLYVSYPSSIYVMKQLRGFEKVHLLPGESVTVKFVVNVRGTSTWNVNNKQWQQVNGKFGVLIGSSATDIRLLDSFTL